MPIYIYQILLLKKHFRKLVSKEYFFKFPPSQNTFLKNIKLFSGKIVFKIALWKIHFQNCFIKIAYPKNRFSKLLPWKGIFWKLVSQIIHFWNCFLKFFTQKTILKLISQKLIFKACSLEKHIPPRLFLYK